MTGPTCRLVRALLPSNWPARRELLDFADRLDRQHGAGAVDVLLAHFTEHRASGHLPADATVRELVLALGELLGGVRAEARARPRKASR